MNATLGLFDGHGDVGVVLHPGSAAYDAPKGEIRTFSGGAENMWFTADAFQFAWKKVTGDVTLTADASFLGEDGNSHRKAVLMIRQIPPMPHYQPRARASRCPCRLSPLCGWRPT
jgi:TolB protein